MKKSIHLLVAIGWFCICTFLLTLPGSRFPKENWFDKIQGDKLVHIVLFAALTWLWCMAFKSQKKKTFLLISFLSFTYGIIMEFIQRNYIPNRGFDIWDMVADGIGSLLGLFFFVRYQKKIDPCGNRGRNQN